jgi:ABC-2 type transport system permease protein
MWLTLFLKECRMWCKSILFLGYVAMIVFFYLTQMGSEDVPLKPEPGQEDYGYHYSTKESDIMRTATESLLQEYCNGIYVTYPIGFYKAVHLNEEKTAKMEVILQKLTGISAEEFKKITEDYNGSTGYQEKDGMILKIENSPLALEIRTDITYKEFLSYMEQAADLIGKGSSYSKNTVVNNARVPLTYEEALKDYNEIYEKDRLSGAYARLFCDYMGILLGVLPVFFITARILKDKHSKVVNVIYGKSISSIVLITARYTAICFMLFVPILLLSIMPLSQAVYAGNTAGITIDYFAFIKYSTGWLLPSILVVTALGYLIGELTEQVLPILVQVVWWFGSIFASSNNMIGGFGFNLIPRFNTLGNYRAFQAGIHQLILNRFLYTVVAVILMAAVIYLYDCKRKGIYGRNGKISKNSLRKSKA